MLKREALTNLGFMLGMILAWSMYYTVSKYAVDTFGSPFLAGLFLRVFAFLFLTAYILAKKQFSSLFKGGLRIALVLFVIGILGYLLDLFANLGFQHGSVSTGTVLLKTDILMANLASALIFKKRLGVLDWIATVVMLVGVVLVLDIDFKDFRLNWYDLFFIASALAVTVNAFVIKSTQRKHSQSSEKIAYYNNFTVMLLFLISAAIAGDFGSGKSEVFSQPYWFWLILAVGGLAQTLIYIFYYRNLKNNEVWKVKLWLLLVPIVSLFSGMAVFGERMTVIKGIGIAVTLLGAACMLIGGRNKKEKGGIAKKC